jgi:hypothetical protein
MQTTTTYVEDIRAKDTYAMVEFLHKEFGSVPGKANFMVDHQHGQIRIEVRSNFKYNEGVCRDFYAAIERANEMYRRYEEWKTFQKLYEGSGSNESE